MTAQQLARQRLAHTDLTAFMPTTKEDKRRRESCEASKRYRATTKGKSTNAKKCREYQRNHPEIVAKAVKKYQDKYAREHGGKLATVPVSERLQAELGAPGDAEATIIAQGTFANNTTSIRALKAAVAKVGLNPEGANNHKFRHSFASNLIRSGINIKAVQQLMRHDSIDITLNTYSHLLQNDLADAVNAI